MFEIDLFYVRNYLYTVYCEFLHNSFIYLISKTVMNGRSVWTTVKCVMYSWHQTSVGEGILRSSSRHLLIWVRFAISAGEAQTGCWGEAPLPLAPLGGYQGVPKSDGRCNLSSLFFALALFWVSSCLNISETPLWRDVSKASWPDGLAISVCSSSVLFRGTVRLSPPTMQRGTHFGPLYLWSHSLSPKIYQVIYQRNFAQHFPLLHSRS